MSLPYHIGNGWFGGMLPLLATAIVAATGDIYYGLWYPIVVAMMTVVIGALFLRRPKTSTSTPAPASNSKSERDSGAAASAAPLLPRSATPGTTMASDSGTSGHGELCRHGTSS